MCDSHLIFLNIFVLLPSFFLRTCRPLKKRLRLPTCPLPSPLPNLRVPPSPAPKVGCLATGQARRSVHGGSAKPSLSRQQLLLLLRQRWLQRRHCRTRAPLRTRRDLRDPTVPSTTTETEILEVISLMETARVSTALTKATSVIPRPRRLVTFWYY